MKLLVITQKVDMHDDVLGFMHGWIAEFARQSEYVHVMCLEERNHLLPSNVSVHSLGKEYRQSRLQYLVRFYWYVWTLRQEYDGVFVHMNHEYVILGGVGWRLLGKRIGLWYAHGHVSWSLRLAERLAHIVFTSTTSGFRLSSRKLRVIGQGIDTERFILNVDILPVEPLRIVTVGRISPIKDYETLIAAVALIKEQGKAITVTIVGSPGTDEQQVYLEQLRILVDERGLSDYIYFIGSVANQALTQVLQEAHLFVNMSHTGSLDKAMLEAMACGLPVISCNEALAEVVGDLQGQLMYPKKDAHALAERIMLLATLEEHDRRTLGEQLRSIVIAHHSLPAFIQTIIRAYKVVAR